MAVAPENLLLYAADPVDLGTAQGIGALLELPPSAVTGRFVTAWLAVAGGAILVIAVGGPAHSALYYNPCGWANPAGTPAGSTPFLAVPGPLATLPGPNRYLNGAGVDRTATLLRSLYLAQFALAGTPPAELPTLWPPVSPTMTCLADMADAVACPCR
ncbi:MAG: hypothetical protein K6U14_04690 [Firmicutes bacterium]|nr:hypothetical protein [Alicyclobacillaceae bacterium]MCL6496917.1 hypothetical protein [Bacillota bacterium]